MREENRAEIIQDALNMLDDELILEADGIREKPVNTMVEQGSISKKSERIDKKSIKGRKTWRYITSIAASVAVFFIAGTVWNEIIVPNQADQMLQSQTQIHLPNQEVGAAAGVESLARVEIPAVEVELAEKKDVIMDMLAFFIYEGRCYVQDEYYTEGFSLVGDYVGTSVGLIDEWTTEDGYVDYAGSISGKFYEVKGYAPEFMLCMKMDNGAVETFIHNNGISLGKGSDLIEERLHLNENIEKTTFKTQEEWDHSLQNENNHVLSEEYDTHIEQFLESFSASDFMYISDTPLDVDESGRYHDDKDNYHLTFHTKDGLRFDFILYEDGYVRFQGFEGVCVQIDPSLYEEIVEVLKAEL